MLDSFIQSAEYDAVHSQSNRDSESRCPDDVVIVS